MSDVPDVPNPFAAPTAAGATAADPDVIGYEPPRTAVIGGLYVCLAANLSGLAPLVLLGESYKDPSLMTEGDPLMWSYFAVTMIGGLAFYLTAFLWARWVLRAARNIRAFSPDGYFSFTPASHVWWFIVPFLSLWKPMEGMREIETVSLMSADIEDVPSKSPIGIWWALWIGQIFMGLFASWIAAWWFTIVAALVGAASALAAVRLVKYINVLQEARARR